LTIDIAIVLIIIVLAVILFITERIRVDLVALIVLVSLTLTKLVTPVEALSGFSNLAVVTVWAVLILSAGLSRTGIASRVSRFLLRYADGSEIRLIVIIMIVVGVLSGLMNNIGVAALMLPVVLDIARQTGRPPSKLLMPLAFASLLGGLTTLIGTPPNILISEALRDADLTPFQMFDFTPVGIVVLLAGIAFMATVGHRLLPFRDTRKDPYSNRNDLDEVYDFAERLFTIRLPESALLDGKSLAESRLGSALGLNVIAILRNNHHTLAPEPNAILFSGDELIVGGRLDLLDEFRGQRHLVLEDNHMTVERLISTEVSIGEMKLAPNSSLYGQTLIESDFRNRFGINVLALWRKEAPIYSNLQNVPLRLGDTLLVQGSREKLDATLEMQDFESLIPISDIELAKSYYLHEGLISLRVPEDSVLIGKSLMESQLGDAFGLGVLGIIRDGRTQLVPSPDEPLLVDDQLLVEGDPDDLKALRGLKELIIDSHLPDLYEFESEEVGLAEVVLSPHSSLAGKTLRELHFRDKYGLSVLAIWREGEPHRSNLRNMALKFGDALLLHGRREKLRVLGSEHDFLVLSEEGQEAPRIRKAPLATAIMVLVLIPAILDWLPISISAVMGMVLMVLSGVLTMDEAYRAIQWKAIFLIAGMLPLGIALERTGAAQLLAEGVVSLLGGLGPVAVIAGLFVLAALASQVMPNAAVAVLLAPVALNTATDMGVSPYPLMMTIAISASAAFLSPVGHTANLLVMGPGRYRFSDYIKVGLPLTMVVLIVVVLVLPLIWPF
jgi:di/tricarboxylate transporter